MNAADDCRPESLLSGLSDVLRNGAMVVEGRMPWSSNATFLVTLHPGEHPLPAAGGPADGNADDGPDDGGFPPLPSGAVRGIYKPGKGERPLWDFPNGLFRREVAAYELSAWLGWDVIPRTVLRNGEYGKGSVQTFIDADFAKHYFTFLQDESWHGQLRTMATFDVLANNADRKGGHVLLDAEGHLWGIDNGLCFHDEPKLRTVIWDFAGESVPDELMADVARLADADDRSLGPLVTLLDDTELGALRNRAHRLLGRGELPAPRSDHAYPWPLV